MAETVFVLGGGASTGRRLNEPRAHKDARTTDGAMVARQYYQPFLQGR